jgi:type IV pilus assembly protein PilO
MDLKGLFANTPKKQLYILLGIMGAALVYGWYMFLYSPAWQDRDQKYREKTRLEQDLIQKRQLRLQLPKLQQAHAELTQALEKAVRALPDEKEIPALLTQINRLGQDAGLVFTLFKPGRPRQDEFVNEIPIQIKTEGDYHALGRFFQEVSRMERIVNVTDLKLDQAKSTRGKASAGIAGEFTATTYTFVEVPEGAQQGKKGVKPK